MLCDLHFSLFFDHNQLYEPFIQHDFWNILLTWLLRPRSNPNVLHLFGIDGRKFLSSTHLSKDWNESLIHSSMCWAFHDYSGKFGSFGMFRALRRFFLLWWEYNLGDLDHFKSYMGVPNWFPMDRLKYLYNSNRYSRDQRILFRPL